MKYGSYSRLIFRIVPAVLVCVVLLAGGPGLFAQEPAGKLPTRDEIAVENTWQLEDIYASEELWEADFARIEELVTQFKAFEGKLGGSSKILLDCLLLDDQLGEIYGKLHLYAFRRRDENTADSKYQALADRLQGLGTKAMSATSFMSPEILAIPDKKLEKFIRKEAALAVYRQYLDDIIRSRPHTLPKEQEALLALAGEPLSASYNAFTMLNNADLTFPTIKGDDGGDLELSKSRYYMLMYSPDRRVRRDAYKGFYTSYEAHKNTLASLFSSNLKASVFTMKARNYDSCLHAALDGNNIPVSIYENLIAAVNENLEPLHRWAALKKRVLDLEELHPYDTYAPLFSETAGKYDFEEAKEMVLKALAPMGEDYCRVLAKSFDERWIDVYENVGKRSGAYCDGTWGVHPYVLLNYSGTLNDVFTLAHEMGHAMHSYYTFANQPFVYSNYSNFVAEVASITNEALLLDYLLERTDGRKEKLALLQKYVENIVLTCYRQTRFAEFEKLASERLEQGEALTAEALDGLFGELYRKYWGPEMALDPEEALSWARIPHFYYDFYVYTYATSFAASELLAKKIMDEGQPAIDRFLDFLGSGNSDYPVNILKKAGVDMSTPEPVVATARKFSALLDQIEALIDEGE